MIVQSPESPMPEPYKSYVDERAGNIAATLGTIVGDTNVQLCPRAILPEERYFPEASNALVYGCVTPSHENGYKSVLYDADDPEAVHGLVAGTAQRAETYALMLMHRGDRVRIKDPEGTNCMGQSVAATLPEVNSVFQAAEIPNGMILMPHLSKIVDRFSIGRIRLGVYGTYSYVGREYITGADEDEKYAGVDLIVTRANNSRALRGAAERLDMPPRVLRLGARSLGRFSSRMIYDGRASVDVLVGTTDSGRPVEAVVDVTPRVGNNTCAEVGGMVELHADPKAVFASASARVSYDPAKKDIPASARRYVDTASLVITAEVTNVG